MELGDSSEVPQDVIDSTEIPDTFIAPIINAPVVLVVSVDFGVVAALIKIWTASAWPAAHRYIR